MTTDTTAATRHRVPVRFRGDRAETGPLTHGQLNILAWLREAGNEAGLAHATLEWAFDIPADFPGGVTVADVVEILSALIGRHETLRTTFSGQDKPLQRVAAAGELMLDVYEAGPDDARDPQELLDEIGDSLRADPYDPETQLPLRVAAVVSGGLVRAVLAGYSHLAVDRQAIAVLKREFTRMLRDPAGRRPGPPVHQPLDQARAEAAPRGRRRAEATLRYFEEQLRRLPQCLYPAPRPGGPGASVAVELWSPAAALALPYVAARTRASRSNVVLAAACAVIAQRTGRTRWPFTVLVGNRFGDRLANYAGTLVQAGLQLADADADGFDELVRRVWTSGLLAGRHGMYDVTRRMELARRIERDRGVAFCFEPFFNNVIIDARDPGIPGPPPADRLIDTLPRTRLRARPMPPTPATVRFDLWEADRALRLDLWTGDSGRVPEGELESMLRAVERLIVAAAAGDLDRAGMRHLIGLPPIGDGGGRLLLDHCLIEPAEVQRLVDDALAPCPARVFPAVDGRELVAFVAATAEGTAHPSGPPGVTSVVQAHDRCMAALPGRPTAMTPRHYVLCERPPRDLADPAAWRREGVLDEGPGR
ncbi:condensation domain-containing protein [Microbispora sp. NPDC088329]|uniref:condensation domain-containing protein n=1 Tax=Microbispora sp. NPDC088329 TaxID=3154869 RepID=UPI0034393FDD